MTQRAYLNGRPYFLRGSNITLHRFFEDPESGTLPWNEAWLHRLLVEIPKQMHWNAFRFCIGPVPDRWLEIADENGLLIQNEYMVWTGHPSWRGGYRDRYDTNEMIGEYKEWIRDNWNHPSVAIWDATNESWLPQFSSTIIPAAVSYTHLDVYKRQLNGFGHLRCEATISGRLCNGRVPAHGAAEAEVVGVCQFALVFDFLAFQANVCLLYTSRCV